MSGRAYQVLHSDAFSAELEALGLDASIFGAAGVPAPVWQALVPRRAGVFDENAHTYGTVDEPANFSRSSDGIYLDSDGSHKIAGAGVIRPEYSSAGAFLGYLFEPASTNKCTNYNANPDAGLTSMTKTGDAASVLSRVSDLSALAAAGLSEVCTDGNVFQLDNSAGSLAANVIVSGTTANLNAHTISAFARRSGGASNPVLQTDTGAFSVNVTTTDSYARFSASGTPGATNNRLMITCPAGVTCRFILNQLEEKAFVTSPIITSGASASRSADDLVWTPITFWDDSQGMVLADLRMSQAITTNQAIIANRGSVTSFFYMHTALSGRFAGYDGTYGPSVAPPIAPDVDYRVALHWGGVKSQIGYKVAGTWTFSSESNYDGAWDANGVANAFRPFFGVWQPCHVKNMRYFNRDFSSAEITRLF